MRKPHAVLRRLVKIVVASCSTGALGLAIAAVYVYRTVPLGRMDLVAVLAVTALAGVLGFSAFGVQAFRKLRPVIVVGEDPSCPAELKQAAVRALWQFPDRAYFLAAQGWVVAVVLCAIAVRLLASGEGWGPVGRVVLAGLWSAPLSALLTHLVATVTCRRGVLEIAALGMDPRQVVDAAPPSRAQLRLRLVAFTAICVLTPAALTLDLSAQASQEVLAAVAQAPDRAARAQVAQALRDRAIIEVGLASALVVALAALTAFAAGVVIGGPMRALAREAHRMAQGVLTPRAFPADDEVWAVSAAFSEMQAHLSRLLSELKRAGVEIGSATDGIIQTSGRYEQGATEQATALNETSATTEELARSARQIAENAGAVADIAQQTLSAARSGQEGADAFSRSMHRMEQDNRAISVAVARLNVRVGQIGRIVEFINGVADKSDLLALNAELEGTKAGEVGRGFSLVAAEMRRLAENVLESTKEIEGLIEEIREATQGAVSATSAGLKATETGGALAREVMQSLQEIVQLAGQTSDAVRSISLATQQQQTGTDQLAEAMADILQVTQQSLASTKQVSAANVDLTGLSTELKAVVGRFRVGDGA